MFMGSLMPDFGRTDYRVKINDDLRMLHETTLFGRAVPLPFAPFMRYNNAYK